MTPLRPLLTALCLAALAVSGPALATQPEEKMPLPPALSQLLGPRPDIDAYSNRDHFVRDILAWEKRRDALEAAWRKGQLSLTPPTRNKEGKLDWHHVTGPEDLETALRNAEGYKQPNYHEKYRFNRTTHISFPLDPLAPEQMATRLVTPPATAHNNPEEATARKLAEQELVTIDESGNLVLAPPPEPDILPQLGSR